MTDTPRRTVLDITTAAGVGLAVRLYEDGSIWVELGNGWEPLTLDEIRQLRNTLTQVLVSKGRDGA